MNTYEQPVKPRKQAQKRLTAGVQKVVDWIQDNDPELKLSVRDIADNANCSVGTAHKAIKHCKTGQK